MAKKHILIVEDEPDIIEILKFNLTREGFSVSAVENGEDALKFIKHNKVPDLIVLDLMLPGIDGLEICRSLKSSAATATIPIIMVTAKDDESDIVAGIELGAEDYVTKPFSIKVLLARIKNILRRKNKTPVDKNAAIEIHDIHINPGKYQVLVKGKPVEMTLSELRILHLLASRPGWVLTREQIIDTIKGEDYAVTDRAVDVQIVSIRKKLGSKAELIETIRGVGYRLKE
jgi:two-component system phosphate regulon response regulator PhoB